MTFGHKRVSRGMSTSRFILQTKTAVFYSIMGRERVTGHAREGVVKLTCAMKPGVLLEFIKTVDFGSGRFLPCQEKAQPYYNSNKCSRMHNNIRAPTKLCMRCVKKKTFASLVTYSKKCMQGWSEEKPRGSCSSTHPAYGCDQARATCLQDHR